MSAIDPKCFLNTRWCFIHNELVIGFPDSRLASDYQQANPEGRIYANANKEVYLPRPEGMVSLRSSSRSDHFSFVLEFRSEEETRAWHKKARISTMFPDDIIMRRVYIDRGLDASRIVGIPH